MLNELPDEILLNIVSYLDVTTLVELKKTSRRMHNIGCDAENMPLYVRHLLNDILWDFYSVVREDFSFKDFTYLSNLLACNTCDCPTDGPSFYKHILRHWTEKNCLAFIYTYCLAANESTLTHAGIRWCAKNEFRILYNVQEWRQELLDLMLGRGEIRMNSYRVDKFSHVILYVFQYGSDAKCKNIYSTIFGNMCTELTLYGGHPMRNPNGVMNKVKLDNANVANGNDGEISDVVKLRRKNENYAFVGELAQLFVESNGSMS